MTTPSRPHWLDQNAQEFLEAYNQKNQTAFTCLSADILIYRGGNEFLCIQPQPMQGRYIVPTVTLSNADTIRNEVLDTLSNVLTATEVEVVLFTEYWFDQPILAHQQSSPSTLRILVLLSVRGSSASNGNWWTRNSTAIGTETRGSGAGVTSKDIYAAVHKIKFSAMRNSLLHDRSSEEFDEACTRTLGASIAARIKIRGGIPFKMYGCIMDEKQGPNEDAPHIIALHETTPDQQQNITALPTSCPQPHPGHHFTPLGRFNGSHIQWRADIEQGKTWWKKVMFVEGRLNVVWR